MSFRDEGDGSVDDPIFVGPQKWPVREYIHTIRLKGFRICQTSLNIRNIYIYIFFGYTEVYDWITF